MEYASVHDLCGRFESTSRHNEVGEIEMADTHLGLSLRLYYSRGSDSRMYTVSEYSTLYFTETLIQRLTMTTKRVLHNFNAHSSRIKEEAEDRVGREAGVRREH